MSNPQTPLHRSPPQFNIDSAPMQRRSAGQHAFSRESGQGLFVLLALLLFVSAGLIFGLARPAPPNIINDKQTAAALAQAKDALIGWAVSHPDKPGLLPYPDRNADLDYDGYSDCPPTSGNSALLLGRLPFIGEKSPCQNPQATINLDKVDGTGEKLWYGVSGNLVRAQTGAPNIPGNLNGTTWLTVRDANGAVLNNLVAFVLLSPGPALPGQNRLGPAPDATNFLDNFTVGGTTYSNWDVALGFISAEETAKVPAGANQFNDQLLYVTRDEFRNAIAKRVAGEVRLALNQYHTTNAFYPDAAPNADGECVSGTVSGYVPSQDTFPDCAGGALTGLLPSWFVDWESYVAYTRNSPDSVTLTIFGGNFAVAP
jgi:hypothetical protein